MKILLTGGTGLIGKALIPQLPQDTHIVVLTRDRYMAAMKFDPYVKLVESLEEVDFNEIDCVINLAGEPIADKRWSHRQKQILKHSRWHLTKELVKRIKKAASPPKLLISGSAIGYYGRQSATGITESFSDVNQEFTHELCEKWESIAMEAQSEQTRVVTLRTGIVLSAQGGALSKMLPAFRMGVGGKLASGEQAMSWIHIQDMVNAIQFLMENESAVGPFNLTAPEPVTNAAFSAALAKTLGRPCALVTPAFVLKGLFGEMSDLLIHGQHVVPDKLIKLGFEFRYPQLEAAFADILNPKHIQKRAAA